MAARAERWFFGVMAALVAVTVFVGFSRTFYLAAWLEAPPGLQPMTPLVLLHGLLFSGWIALLLGQTGLVAAGRTDIHRRLGAATAGVAVLMVIVGTMTAVYALARGSTPPGIEPRRFLAVPLFDMVVFGALVFAGIRKRRDPPTHKRLMLLATIAILSAAIARWPLAFLKAGPPAFFGINDLYLLPLVGFDLATRGRVHRATLAGGLLIVISQPLRLLVSGTEPWLRFADLAASLAR